MKQIKTKRSNGRKKSVPVLPTKAENEQSYLEFELGIGKDKLEQAQGGKLRICIEHKDSYVEYAQYTKNLQEVLDATTIVAQAYDKVRTATLFQK